MNHTTEPPNPVTLLFRFCAGRPLNGALKTDATFLHRGTTKLTALRVGRWSWLAGWERAAIRLGIVALLVATTWLYLFHREVLPTIARVAFWTTLPLAVVAGVNRIRSRQYHIEYVLPLARWYSAKYVVPIHDAVARIEVPRGHIDDPDASVTVKLPPDFQATDRIKQDVAGHVAASVGIKDPSWDLDMVGLYLTLTIQSAPAPPAAVTYDDMLEHLQAARRIDCLPALPANVRACRHT